MISTLEAIADFAQAYGTCNVLQFAVAIRRAGQAVERVVGDIKLHDVAPHFGEPRRLRPDLHAVLDRRRAGGRVALTALDLDEAHAAGAERFEAVRRAKAGNIDAGGSCCAQYGRASRHTGRHAVDTDTDRFGIFGRRRTEIRLAYLVHEPGPRWGAKSSAKYFRILRTG